MTREVTGAERQGPAKLPPQATMGLLAYLGSHTLDEDYAFVSRRRKATGAPTKKRRGAGPLAGVVLLVFALLVVTAGAQTSRNAVNDEAQRRELGAQVEAAREQLTRDRAQVEALTAETQRLETQQLASDASAQGVLSDITRLGTRAGTIPVRGPGVRMVADDAPDATEDRDKVLDSDLQRLVNGLWEAGAEAISVNGLRLTALSAIRTAGVAITVNGRSLRRPYTVEAIGNPDTLPARFAETSSGQAWLDLQRGVGLQLDITTVSSLQLPATDLPTLRFANQKPGGVS